MARRIAPTAASERSVLANRLSPVECKVSHKGARTITITKDATIVSILKYN